MAGPPQAVSSDYTGHIFIASGRFIPEDTFSNAFNVDYKTELGLSFDLKKKSWPVSIAYDFSFLFNKSRTAENRHNLEENKRIYFLRTDSSPGIKKVFDLPQGFKPFIGSGLYFVRVYGKLDGERKTKTGVGYWLGAGFCFDFHENLSCGFSWKKTKADLKIFGVGADVGGNHYNLMAGFHF